MNSPQACASGPNSDAGDMVPKADSPPLPPPSLRFEKRAVRRGATLVAGVDEAGRGPLAGPVVVAAVILNRRRIPEGLNDSKQLSADRRAELYNEILDSATVSVVAAPTSIIAELNILHATMWAMRRAVMGLSLLPDHVLIDGNTVPKGMPCATEAVIDGDALSLSIAAASIVAKVTRDRIMCELALDHPVYAWESNKGYNTASHRAGLVRHGPCRHHRRSFSTVAKMLIPQPVTLL